MKRILTALVLALCIFSLSASNLDYITVSSDNFRLYDSYGARIDLKDEIPSDLEGVIVLTDEEPVTFNTVYGDITLSSSSIFSILSLDPSSPTFYLVNGEASIDLKEDVSTLFYTPVTLTAITKAGSYKLVSTEDEEAVYNYSESESIYSFDATTGVTYTLEPLTYSSLTKQVLNKAITEDVIEEDNATTPTMPVLKDVVRRLSLPSAHKVYVEGRYMPVLPSQPSIFYDISLQTTGTPERPEIRAISYETGLVAPSVQTIELEKKTIAD